MKSVFRIGIVVGWILGGFGQFYFGSWPCLCVWLAQSLVVSTCAMTLTSLNESDEKDS